MKTLSPRFLALPVAALAVIFALSQAHSQSDARSAEAGPSVIRVSNCAVPANTLTAACVVADKAGATLVR
jgi:hypothetical protein